MQNNLRRLISYVGCKVILSPHKVSIQGDIDASKTPYVVVANHTSLLDGFLIAHLFKGNVAFVFDSRLLKYPLFRLLSLLFDGIPFNQRNSILVIKRALRDLNDNKSVVMFPEGKMNVEGEDLEWKRGAIYLAQKSGKQILPISIINADKVWNANAYLPTPGHIDMLLHPPITPDEDCSASVIKRIVTQPILASN